MGCCTPSRVWSQAVGVDLQIAEFDHPPRMDAPPRQRTFLPLSEGGLGLGNMLLNRITWLCVEEGCLHRIVHAVRVKASGSLPPLPAVTLPPIPPPSLPPPQPRARREACRSCVRHRWASTHN